MDRVTRRETFTRWPFKIGLTVGQLCAMNYKVARVYLVYELMPLHLLQALGMGALRFTVGRALLAIN